MKKNIKYRTLFLYSCLFAGSAFLISLLIYITDARMSAYPYDTSLNYNYNFKGSDAKIIDLKLKDGKLTLPYFDRTKPFTVSEIKRASDLIRYSAFLKVSVSTTFMGKFFQPEAELISYFYPADNVNEKANNINSTINDSRAKPIKQKVSILEYFENGAQGVRYINVSPLFAPFISADELDSKISKIEIQLKGKRVSFQDQRAELILFKNHDISNSKIVIIAPHPDDAEIAAFGLYSSLAVPNRSNPSGSSKNIYVATITAGDAGTYQYDEIYSSRKNHFLKKGKIRTWNSITVPLLGGVQSDNVINLGFFDGTLQTMFEKNPESVKALYTGISNIKIFRQQNISPLADLLTGGANWNSLVENLVNLLKYIKPDIIVTPYPALDRHPDHKFTSIALFEAIKQVAIINADEKNENQEQERAEQNENQPADSHQSYDIRRAYLYFYTNHFVLNEYYPYGQMGAVISLPPVFKNIEHSGEKDKELPIKAELAMDNIYFRAIYSHQLSADRQREKILSLEAMNDLRPDTSWRFSKEALKMAVASVKRDIMGKNVSYYRRAVRNNELFFVVPVSDIYNPAVLSKIIGF